MNAGIRADTRGAWSGVAFAVTCLLAMIVLLMPMISPDSVRPGSTGLMVMIMVGERAFRLSILFFLFFLSVLWVALRRAERDTGWPAVAGFAGGLVAAVLLLATVAVRGVMNHADSCVGRAGQMGCELWTSALSPEMSAVLSTLAWKLMAAGYLCLAGFLIGTAVAGRRAGLLPAWLSRTAWVLAAALLLGSIPEMEFVLYPFLLFWTGAAVLTLMRTSSSVVSRALPGSSGPLGAEC